jgi:hypothetical protein
MRAAGTTLGSLGLFGSTVGELNEADLLVARSLAHIASVAIVQEHPPTQAGVMPHLRTALASRIVVEQAKGFLRERLDIAVAEAFALLRGYAHSAGIHLSELARQIMSEPEKRPALLAALSEYSVSSAEANKIQDI